MSLTHTFCAVSHLMRSNDAEEGVADDVVQALVEPDLVLEDEGGVGGVLTAQEVIRSLRKEVVFLLNTGSFFLYLHEQVIGCLHPDVGEADLGRRLPALDPAAPGHVHDSVEAAGPDESS